MDQRSLLGLRGQNISMIFREPAYVAEPSVRAGEKHFLEMIHYHDPSMPREKALAEVEKLLAEPRHREQNA